MKGRYRRHHSLMVSARSSRSALLDHRGWHRVRLDNLFECPRLYRLHHMMIGIQPRLRAADPHPVSPLTQPTTSNAVALTPVISSPRRSRSFPGVRCPAAPRLGDIRLQSRPRILHRKPLERHDRRLLKVPPPFPPNRDLSSTINIRCFVRALAGCHVVDDSLADRF